MRNAIVAVSIALLSIFARAEEPKPVVVRADCDGKLTSMLLTSFKEAIGNSRKYEIVPDLTNNGKNGIVLVIQMTCGERNNAVAVASVYGLAKCYGPKNCHQSVSASTLNILMCDLNSEAQCGRELFKELESILSTDRMQGLALD